MQCFFFILLCLASLCLIIKKINAFEFPSDENYYCEVHCDIENKDSHTLCLNPSCKLRPPCTGLPRFSTTDRTEIVDFHNFIRNKVAFGDVIGQLPASDMREMTWDTQLEVLAECWVHYCPSADRMHAGCNDIPPRFSVTQNIMLKQYTNLTIPYEISTYKSVLLEWFQEYKNFKVTRNLNYRRAKFQSYTQMVWSKSYLIGCARNKFQSGLNELVLMFVCNYGPGGNIENMTAYVKGERCTGCSAATECNPKHKYSGLCQLSGETLTETIFFRKELDPPNVVPKSCSLKFRFNALFLLAVIIFSLSGR